MLKNKILFISKRYNHNNNKVLISKNLSFLLVTFLLVTLFIVVTRSFKSIIKNESNENNFDINQLKDISNRKKLISTLKTFKEKMIQKFNFIDIVKINALAYYYLIKNKENKLFSLIINKIYDTFIESFEISLRMK